MNTSRSLTDSNTSKNSWNSKEMLKANGRTKRHCDSHLHSSNGNTEDSSLRRSSSSPSDIALAPETLFILIDGYLIEVVLVIQNTRFEFIVAQT